MRIEPAWTGSIRTSLRSRLGVGVLAHRAAREARGPADRRQALSGQVTPSDLFIGDAPSAPVLDAHGDLGIAAPESLRSLAKPGAGFLLDRQGRQASQACMDRASQRSTACRML